MRRAFSLVEVIITIAVLGIIAGIGVMQFSKLRVDAVNNVLRARIKQLNIAKQQYISEFGRLEAENNWKNAYGATYISPDSDNACYNLLKRYIERPQASFADLTPSDDTGVVKIITPATVWVSYGGVDTNGTSFTDTP